MRKKRNLRFYFALFFAKGTALVLKLIGRKGTSMPGSWAIILCPDFLDRIEKPKKVIGVTGTNGKTTVCNMVEDVLEDQGYDFTCNRAGTNVATGVASSLIADSTFFGKPTKDLAVFELDERSAPHVLPYIKPDMLLCTNIFRDSYKRNAHVDFILGILNESIPKGTKLILNSDDLLCSSIAPENDRVYFGIDKLEGETNTIKNIVCDVRVCPVCGKSLTWDFIRYHHIGRAKCESCGFESPKPDYRVTEIRDGSMTLETAGNDAGAIYPLANSAPINVYNSLSAVSFLTEFGLTAQQIRASMEKLTISETRYQEETVGDKKIILHLAKGQNPVACSRAFENVRDYKRGSGGRKAVILFLDDFFDAKNSVENFSWLYDTDFEFLNDDSIVQLIVAGERHFDSNVRMLMAGIPESKISHIRDLEGPVDYVKPDEIDTVFILYDVHTIGLANRTKAKLIEALKEGKTNEN